MVNKYLYTDEIIRETMKKSINKLVIVLDVIAMLICIYCTYKGVLLDSTFLIVEGVFLLFFVICINAYKIKKAIDIQIERIRVQYGEEPQEITIELKDNIKMYIKDSKKEIAFNDVISYKETDNLLIILLKGKMTIPLKKDSFVEGSMKECKELLDGIVNGR